MRMHKPAAALALALTTTAAWAQEETVPVSVEGTIVEVNSDIAAAACGLDDDQLEAALQGTGEVGTATEVETAATTTGTTEDTSTGTTDDVTAMAETGGGAIPAGDDAPEGTDPELTSGDDEADDAADDAGGETSADTADDADDMATADAAGGATPLCEISEAEAIAQEIELP